MSDQLSIGKAVQKENEHEQDWPGGHLWPVTGVDRCLLELLPAVPCVGSALGALSVPAGRGGRPALLGAGQLGKEGGTSTSRRVKTSGGSPPMPPMHLFFVCRKI